MTKIQNYIDTGNSDFDFFRELPPAATKLILEPKETELTEILKLIFLDLLLKKVLILKTETRTSNSRDPHLREYLIVETGENYKKYKPKRFEKNFTDIIDEDSYYILRAYLKRIYKKIDQSYSYKQKILRDLNKFSFFKDTLINNMFGILKLNQIGKVFQTDLKSKLEKIDKEIVEILKNNSTKAVEIIDSLRGNIFLLNNLDFELLSNIKKTDFTQNITTNYTDDWYWIDFFDDSDYLFDSLSHSFESLDTFFDSDFGSNWDGGSDFDFD